MSKTLVIGTIAIVLLVFALGGFLLWRQSSPAPAQPTVEQTPPPAPSPQPQGEILDTSSWQTYRNDEFGFEVRYPNGWTLSTRPGFRVIPKNVDAKYGKLLFFDFIPHGSGIGDLVLVVGHTRFAIEEELNAECFPESKPFEIIVSEAQGLAVEGKYLCPPMHGPGSFGSMRREIVVLKGGILYHFTSYVVAEKETQKIVDQILSTFRFVE